MPPSPQSRALFGAVGSGGISWRRAARAPSFEAPCLARHALLPWQPSNVHGKELCRGREELALRGDLSNLKPLNSEAMLGLEALATHGGRLSHPFPPLPLASSHPFRSESAFPAYDNRTHSIRPNGREQSKSHVKAEGQGQPRIPIQGNLWKSWNQNQRNRVKQVPESSVAETGHIGHMPNRAWVLVSCIS